MKKSLTRILSILIIASLLAACSPGDSGNGTTTDAGTTSNGSGEDGTEGDLTEDNNGIDANGKYDPPITLTAIRGVNSSRTFSPGETWDDNIWTRAFEEHLGITFDYIWTTDTSEYNAKINIAIVSDDLADVMSVPYDPFYRMAELGKLADLTEAHENAPQQIKDNLALRDGIALSATSIDGRVYGIGRSPGYDTQMLWYRNDWADSLGIGRPETFDDVLEMAERFVDEKPGGEDTQVVGIPINNSLFGGAENLQGYFAVYDAYPTIWVEKDGGIVHGAIQDETKEALRSLQDLFERGIIDRDFINKAGWSDIKDDTLRNKVGIALAGGTWGDWLAGELMAAFGEDATWTVMGIPNFDGDIINTPQSMRQANVLAAVADSEHPEALYKIIALIQELISEPGYHTATDEGGNSVSNFFHVNDFFGAVGGRPDNNYQHALNVTEALESGDTSILNAESQGYYDRSSAYLAGSDLSGYRSYITFGPDGAQITLWELGEEGYVQPEAYYGPNTDTMNDRLGNLISKRDEIYTRIIMGEDVESEWSDWLSFWSSQGGDLITEEVNEWAANR